MFSFTRSISQLASALQLLLPLLLLLLAVAHWPSEVEALGRRQLPEYCVNLDRKLARHQKDRTDSPATYNLAMWYVESFFNSGRWERRHLAEAWDTITFKPKCSTKTLDYVNTIGICAPERLETLRYTLNKDTRRYVMKCVTPRLLNKQLKRRMRGPWVFEHPRKLNRFLSEGFLSVYAEVNKDEKRLQADCCKPERSAKALVRAIEDLYVRRNKGAPAEHLGGRRKRVTKLLRRHLYRPCADYIKNLFPLMRGILASGKYFEGGLEALLGAQTKKLQDAFFRYQFCQHLRGRKTRKQLVDQVIAEFQAAI